MDILKKTSEIRYLLFTSTDGNKKVLAKFTKLWNKIKHLIKTRNEGKKGEYEKDFIKIKFNSDDNLPLNKMLKLHMLTVIVRSDFEEDSKYYPQFFGWMFVWCINARIW